MKNVKLTNHKYAIWANGWWYCGPGKLWSREAKDRKLYVWKKACKVAADIRTTQTDRTDCSIHCAMVQLKAAKKKGAC